MRRDSLPHGGAEGLTTKGLCGVIARLRDLLDERIDVVAATVRQTRRARVAIAVTVAALIAILLAPATAAIWLAIYGLAETWTRAASSPLLRGRALSHRGRASYLASIFVQSLTWSSLALIFWTGGTEPYRMGAIVALAGLLVHAQGFSFRAPQTLVLLATPPAVLWLALPVFFGGYSNPELFALTVGLLTTLAYVAASARANLRSANALAAAERAAVTANEAKSAFLAMMSHELRTPLNGVMGMARALQRTSLDARQQGHVEMILRSGDGLLTILNDVLDLSKIEAGRMDLEICAFDLRDVAEGAVALWAEQAAAKRLVLACEIDPDLPAAVLGDETRVRQIVLNLVSNALKFTDAGEIVIAVRPEPAADGDGGIAISVRDTGIGISEEQAESLFRPFAQAEASTARRYGGTGLGLSICRTLSTRMGGDISVDSRPGEGSTFRVWLPLPPAPATEAQAEAQPSALPPLRILVADDNPINQTVARAVLEAAGARVEVADDGAQALAQLRVAAFDVVLMDVNMPRMDGIEAVSRIRAGQAGRADVPVLALTADAMAGEEARLKALGFNGLQAKPVQPAALIGAIAEVTAGREPVGDTKAA